MNRPPGFEEVGKAPAWVRLQTAITPTASSPGISSGASATESSSRRLRFREPGARLGGLDLSALPVCGVSQCAAKHTGRPPYSLRSRNTARTVISMIFRSSQSDQFSM